MAKAKKKADPKEEPELEEPKGMKIEIKTMQEHVGKVRVTFSDGSTLVIDQAKAKKLCKLRNQCTSPMTVEKIDAMCGS